jgi:hypothetical protein
MADTVVAGLSRNSQWYWLALGGLAALALIAFLPAPAEAQPPPAAPPTPAPSNCNYVIDNNAPYNWEEIAPSLGGSGTPVSGFWDYSTQWITPNMPFFLCGTWYYDMYLVSKGHVCFGTNPGAVWPNNPAGCSSCCPYSPWTLFPSSSVNRPGVFGYYTDLHTGACNGFAGSQTCVFWTVTGTGANKRFIYEFLDVPYYYNAPAPYQTFQIKLFEQSGCMEVHYKSTGGGATWYPTGAGFQNDQGNAGWAYQYVSSSPWGFAANSQAWRACPATPPGPPPPRCSPQSQTFSAVPQTTTLTGQYGVQPYTWSVSPAGASAPSWTGTTFTPTFSSAGTYIVRVTGADGSSSTCKVRIVQPQCGYTIKTTDTDPGLYQWDEIAPSSGGGGTPVPNMWYYTVHSLTPGTPASTGAPMTFNFCGDDYSTFRLTGSGHICFDNSNTPTGTFNYYWDSGLNYCGYFYPYNLPSPPSYWWVPKPAVFGLWTLVNPGYCPGYQSSNCLYYKLSGLPGDRVLTYEFDKVPIAWGYSPYKTFQIKLFESSGCIEAHYKSVGSTPSYPYYPSGAGYQNVDASAGYTAFYHNAYTTWSRSGYAWQACPNSWVFNEDQPKQKFDVTKMDSMSGLPFSVVAWSQPAKGLVERADGRGNMTFKPYADQVGADKFTYTIQDSLGNQKTKTLDLTINPVNDAPVLTLTTQKVVLKPTTQSKVIPGIGTLVGPGPKTATDEAGQQVTFAVTVSDPDLFLVLPTVERTTSPVATSASPSPALGEHALLRFTSKGLSGTTDVCVRPVDNGGTATVTNTWKATAMGVNVGEESCMKLAFNYDPVAYFEPSSDSVQVFRTVTFNPCPKPAPYCTMDPDDAISMRLWEFGDGGLSADVQPVHSYAVPGTYTARLTVWDTHGAYATYAREIKVEPNDAMAVEEDLGGATLTADAGRDRTVFEGAEVVLQGSQEGGGEGTTYEWTLLSPSDVVLLGAGTATPSFTAPRLATMEPVDLQFALRVREGARVSEPDYVTIHVVSANGMPVAVAGEAFTVRPGESVRLDGTASTDPDGDVLSYRWEQALQPGDRAVALSGEGTPTASFVAPATTGTLAFRLRVTDGRAEAVDQVLVTVLPQAARPEPAFTFDILPSAGGADVRFVAATGLDGVRWDFGDGATAEGSTVMHTFQPGTYEVTMTVDFEGKPFDVSRSLTIERAVAGEAAAGGLDIGLLALAGAMALAAVLVALFVVRRARKS